MTSPWKPSINVFLFKHVQKQNNSYLYLFGVLKTLLPNGPFASKVATIKTKSTTNFLSSRLLSSSSLFLFLIFFPFVSVILQLIGPKKSCLSAPLSLKWLHLSLGWFPNNRLDILTYDRINEWAAIMKEVNTSFDFL